MSIRSKVLWFFLLVAASPLIAAGFTVTSPAVSGPSETGFDSGLISAGRLDAQYAAKAGGPSNPRSFPFSWSSVPAGTKALALILDDPDARLVLAARGVKLPAFLHWTVTDIDPSLGGLPANASADMASLVQGKNGTGQIGYRGPQPPADFPPNTGKKLIHVYRLALYALSAPTGLAKGYSLDELRKAIKDKVLAEARLNISYSND
ncbi:MAG TPA: YbhB/YbcL family Raf kinase inhibitor-like protein [Spirochaetia bacterium]|nr:YbhB/YbcL family Raf kinase inhibitor-like protein [Spirochaetia bacterium]